MRPAGPNPARGALRRHPHRARTGVTVPRRGRVRPGAGLSHGVHPAAGGPAGDGRRNRGPALIMRGTRDRVVPAEIIDSLRGVRPDWTYHQLEGVGHVPQFEAPEEVARIIIDWALTKRITPLSAT
ncbi:alpha/beta fold hydrolase [Actinoallomurus acanthiterrae]